MLNALIKQYRLGIYLRHLIEIEDSGKLNTTVAPDAVEILHHPELKSTSLLYKHERLGMGITSIYQLRDKDYLKLNFFIDHIYSINF